MKYAILLDSFSLTVSVHKVHSSILFDMNEEKKVCFVAFFKRDSLCLQKRSKALFKGEMKKNIMFSGRVATMIIQVVYNNRTF